ncbi:MAG: nucleotidyltransferase domain-containing protein [Natronospirillum sp.]|uniref:nucleotidyltransferase domain-containing protein n=1 Tax=Natronospirillum sp. TaxID=2812955 RepID=UPI0025CC1D9B|nr:nucleotidyltransferase domain-containing protein [Natronospirillum sp.]MCH8553030.1 nucleotidyltransferase domain-containing protein [Natronospirillum sp.]
MRLTQAQINTIKTETAAVFGANAEVILFGSRLDDSARGGDVDLMVRVREPVSDPANLSGQLSARLMRAFHGRKVDVVVQAPNLTGLPIHRVASQQGQVL